ncbi:hypothetical protein ACFVY9_03770 [Streptomyces sp. NPDC059544]|uniref:hypothetical protein n=1 Tax=Streptomyces sp. NPDC059544 TaxID=3346861 RepID=UPI00369C65AA
MTVATAAPQTRAHTAPAADATTAQLPYAVEDFAYPGAEQLFTEKGIILRKGDGHILLTDCAGDHQIKVSTLQSEQGGYCFRVIGKSGTLALEVNKVHAIRTAERAVRASLTMDGETTTVDVPKNDYKPVGEGDVKDGRRAVLVELKVTG